MGGVGGKLLQLYVGVVAGQLHLLLLQVEGDGVNQLSLLLRLLVQ